MKSLCRAAAVIAVLVVAMLHSGCITPEDDDDELVKPGPLVVLDEDVERASADEVEVYLEQGSGSLELVGGGSKLMEATFRFNIDRWEPEIAYQQVGGAWNLSVVQPNTDLRVATGARNEWDITLGDSIPIHLTVILGAGNADIAVGSLDLKDLDVNLGAGNLELDVSAYQGGNLTVAINCGAGDVDLRVPSGMGVRIIPLLGVGSISATGFTMVGAEYHSSDYDPDQPHIVVTAILGVGDLSVIES